jgi:hypothetical protein
MKALRAIRLPGLAVLAATTIVVVGLAGEGVMGQPAAGAGGRYQGPRTSDGKPDLNGIWQVLNSAHWNLEPHSPEEGVPGGQGVVEGGSIPYQPWALEKRKENAARRATADPLSKCYLPGVPRVTYVPLPFEIVQTPTYVVIAYEIAHARRIIYTDGSPHVEALEFWMGDSRGKWEGDTLVVSTNNLTDKTWLDKAGNFHSTALHVIERYTPRGPDHIQYEVTLEDPKVYTRPWKMNMILYRRVEPAVQLLDYDCVSFFWKRTLAGK